MKKVCCRCKVYMGEIESFNDDKDVITHGLCDPCAEKFMYEELGTPLHEFLDTLNAPVMLIEPGPKVRTANTQACDMLGKSLADIEGHKGGEVIECVHAKTPEGCGNAVHCSSCTIRNTVLATFETGDSHEKVLAYPDIQIGEEDKTMCIEISTEKIGQLVLLRIDDMRANNEAEMPTSG